MPEIIAPPGTEERGAGGLSYLYHPHIMTFTDDEIAELQRPVRAMTRFFSDHHYENNAANRRFREPALLLRTDSFGEFVLEVEDLPLGLGASCNVNEQLMTYREQLLQTGIWPRVQFVRGTQDSDDSIWLPECSLADALDHPGDHPYLLLRLMYDAEHLADEDRDTLQRASIGPWQFTRRKDYGGPDGLKLWECLVYNEGTVSYLKSFGPSVIKPLSGCRAKGVVFIVSQQDREEMDLIYEAGEVLSWEEDEEELRGILSRMGKFNLQRFKRPITLPDVLPGYNILQRCYFAFIPGKGWVPMGGVWLACKRLVLHGEGHYIIGAAQPETNHFQL